MESQLSGKEINTAVQFTRFRAESLFLVHSIPVFFLRCVNVREEALVLLRGFSWWLLPTNHKVSWPLHVSSSSQDVDRTSFSLAKPLSSAIYNPVHWTQCLLHFGRISVPSSCAACWWYGPALCGPSWKTEPEMSHLWWKCQTCSVPLQCIGSVTAVLLETSSAVTSPLLELQHSACAHSVPSYG